MIGQGSRAPVDGQGVRADPRPLRPGARLYITAAHTAGVLVGCALLTLAGGVWPGSPLTPVGRWYGAAVVLFVLALGTWLARHRKATPVVALLLAVPVGGFLVASCQTQVGVATTALGLVVAGQFSSLLGGRRFVVALVALVLAVLAVAMVLAPVPFRGATWLVLATMTSVTAALVAYLMGRLREYATTDDLTGVLLRAEFDHRATALVQQAARRGRPVSVVYLDVDDFKVVNDTRGHQAGDEVLVRLVSRLREALGREDLIGRMGGDEFAVVLAGRTAAGAEDWVRVVVARRTPEESSWSHGVAQAGVDEPVRDALARADAALYARKGLRVDDPA